MRILALTWTTFENEKELMINNRGDLLCPATDGIVNELLKLGHQVVYVNCTPWDTNCVTFISGLPYNRWENIKNRNFDLIWHDVKDPTPEAAIGPVMAITNEFSGIPILNHVEHLKDHTKRKYITKLREKNVGAIILDDYTKWLGENGKIDYKNKCFPASQGCRVSLDKYAIRLHDRNSARSNLNDNGITLRYQDTSKLPDAKPGFRSFFRVPYAAGKCLEGTKYFCPEDILCPKSGAAVEKEPFQIPDMSAGTVSAAMKELGIDIAHVEGVQAGFSIEIFDVNPFPSSHGASLQPMSEKIAKRLEQVYDI